MNNSKCTFPPYPVYRIQCYLRLQAPTGGFGTYVLYLPGIGRDYFDVCVHLLCLRRESACVWCFTAFVICYTSEKVQNFTVMVVSVLFQVSVLITNIFKAITSWEQILSNLNQQLLSLTLVLEQFKPSGIGLSLSSGILSEGESLPVDCQTETAPNASAAHALGATED